MWEEKITTQRKRGTIHNNHLTIWDINNRDYTSREFKQKLGNVITNLKLNDLLFIFEPARREIYPLLREAFSRFKSTQQFESLSKKHNRKTSFM